MPPNIDPKKLATYSHEMIQLLHQGNRPWDVDTSVGKKDLSYRSLQQWAKENGVRANQKKSALLKAWNKAQGLGKQGTLFGAENLKGVPIGQPKTAPGINLGPQQTLASPWAGNVRGGGSAGMERSQIRSDMVDQWRAGQKGPSMAGVADLDRGKTVRYTGGGTTASVGPKTPGTNLPPISGERVPPSKSLAPIKGMPKFETNPALQGAKKAGKFLRFLGPAANALFLGMMVYDIARRGGGFGGHTDAQTQAAALMQGSMVPQMGQRSMIASDLARQGMQATEMEGLANWAKEKQRGQGEFRRGMSAELDNLLAMKEARIARASLMGPDIQQHLANLTSTGTF